MSRYLAVLFLAVFSAGFFLGGVCVFWAVTR